MNCFKTAVNHCTRLPRRFAPRNDGEVALLEGLTDWIPAFAGMTLLSTLRRNDASEHDAKRAIASEFTPFALKNMTRLAKCIFFLL